MSAITVRSMLALILENNLQMDDEINFELSPETCEINERPEEINFVSNYVSIIDGETCKTLNLVFDLDEMVYGE